MAESSRILIAHRVLLVVGVIAWLIGSGGSLYAYFFVSNARAPLAVMSHRTFTQVAAISIGWWLSVAVLVIALVLLGISRGFRGSTFPAVAVSALYVFVFGLFALFARHFHG